MYAYPSQARVGRRVPKSVIYRNAKPSAAVKALFVRQVEEITWQYKLAEDTINLPAKAGYAEIQVFDLSLKEPMLDARVLQAIDRAIPYPIFFRLHHQDRINLAASYKRPDRSDKNRWVTGACFETGWKDDPEPPQSLPVALDMRALYEQMLVPYIGMPCQFEETVAELAERFQSIRKTEREISMLKSRMKKEKQFNRKVDLNNAIRELQKEYEKLTKSS